MGPLSGFTIIELAGLGPAPMAGMMLADMGANLIRIERSDLRDPLHTRDASYRGKKSVVLNLKSSEGKAALLKMILKADALIEGYRPGVTEKMGLGPEDCWKVNPKLVYGRITGWGQTGPLSNAAGHDINYISLTGGLFATGRPDETPAIPVNALGDGTGGILLVAGVLAALLECQKSGKGQVVDAAMIDSSALCMWMMHGFHAIGQWQANNRGVNILDGGAHFYDSFETADKKYVSIGSIEPQFYHLLLEKTGITDPEFQYQMDSKKWPSLKEKLKAVFKSKTQSQWCDIMEGTDVCFAPVLSLSDAPNHPHHQARKTYVEIDGFAQPGPSPRFSRTENKIRHGQHSPGQDTRDILQWAGLSEAKIQQLMDS